MGLLAVCAKRLTVVSDYGHDRRAFFPGRFEPVLHAVYEVVDESNLSDIWFGRKTLTVLHRGIVRRMSIVKMDPAEEGLVVPSSLEPPEGGLDGEVSSPGGNRMPTSVHTPAQVVIVDVEPLIEQQLGDLDIPIYVYATYHADQKAVEPNS